MKRVLTTVAALLFGMGGVIAQSDVIAQRRQIMKATGTAFFRDLGDIAKGTAPYNSAKVRGALTVIADASKKMPMLFPDTSKIGDTNALPKLWEAKADVDARYAKLDKDASDALATVKDLASLKTTMAALVKNCDGCHELYRAKMQ